MLDFKALISDFTKEAQIAGFYPKTSTYRELCGSFDYDFFAKESKILKTDATAIALYKMVFLSSVLLLEGDDFGNNHNFTDFGIKYCGANDIMLNELFGEFKKVPLDIKESQLTYLEEGFYTLFGNIYEHFPTGFHTNWILSHFESKGCIKYGDSYLVEDGFFGLDIMGETLRRLICITPALDEYLQYRAGIDWMPDDDDYEDDDYIDWD